MSFSQKVTQLLKERKMSKAALAKEIGIPYTTLDSMLKRETDTARLTSVFRIARALGTSVEALVFDEENENALSPEELRVLELYSLLDPRGKNTVLSLLESQADYSRENREELRSIPVYEAPAAAGAALPVLTEDAVDHSFEKGQIPDEATCGIRVSGDSMEPLLFHGDVVYVEAGGEISSGQIGVFLLNGESLCKKYLRKGEETYLVSLNPKYEPIRILESDELRLVGRVVLREDS